MPARKCLRMLGAFTAIAHAKTFESLLVRGCKIPGFDVKDVKPPVLGPLPGGNVLEKYNRINTLLRSVKHMLAPTRWRSLFVKSTDPFPPTIIGPSSITIWMRAQNDLPRQLQSNFTESADPMPTIVRLSLGRSVDTKWERALRQHEIDFIKYEGLTLPTVSNLAKDPTAYPNGALWRDTIRRQLKFAKLKVDFLTMKTDYEPGNWIFSLTEPENVLSWGQFLERLPQTDVSLIYTLQVVDGDEEEFGYEWDGPILAILDDIIQSADNDATLINEAPPTETKAMPSSLLVSYQEISKQLSQFGDFGVVQNQSKPSSYYHPHSE